MTGRRFKRLAVGLIATLLPSTAMAAMGEVPGVNYVTSQGVFGPFPLPNGPVPSSTGMDKPLTPAQISEMNKAAKVWAGHTRSVSFFLDVGKGIKDDTIFKQQAQRALTAALDEPVQKSNMEKFLASDPVVSVGNQTLENGSFQGIVDNIRIMASQGRAMSNLIDAVNGIRCAQILPSIDAYFAVAARESKTKGESAVRPLMCGKVLAAASAGQPAPGNIPSNPVADPQAIASSSPIVRAGPKPGAAAPKDAKPAARKHKRQQGPVQALVGIPGDLIGSVVGGVRGIVDGGLGLANGVFSFGGGNGRVVAVPVESVDPVVNGVGRFGRRALAKQRRAASIEKRQNQGLLTQVVKTPGSLVGAVADGAVGVVDQGVGLVTGLLGGSAGANNPVLGFNIGGRYAEVPVDQNGRPLVARDAEPGAPLRRRSIPIEKRQNQGLLTQVVKTPGSLVGAVADGAVGVVDQGVGLFSGLLGGGGGSTNPVLGFNVGGGRYVTVPVDQNGQPLVARDIESGVPLRRRSVPIEKRQNQGLLTQVVKTPGSLVGAVADGAVGVVDQGVGLFGGLLGGTGGANNPVLGFNIGGGRYVTVPVDQNGRPINKREPSPLEKRQNQGLLTQVVKTPGSLVGAVADGAVGVVDQGVGLFGGLLGGTGGANNPVLGFNIGGGRYVTVPVDQAGRPINKREPSPLEKRQNQGLLTQVVKTPGSLVGAVADGAVGVVDQGVGLFSGLLGGGGGSTNPVLGFNVGGGGGRFVAVDQNGQQFAVQN